MELRNHGFTKKFFYVFACCGIDPRKWVVARGMAMAAKLALTDRAMTLDTDAMKAHQSHRRYFFCFFLISPREEP
jgi:hypothetical protein